MDSINVPIIIKSQCIDMKYITKKLDFSNQTLEEMSLNSKKFYNLIQKRRSVRQFKTDLIDFTTVSYTHLRAHETR